MSQAADAKVPEIDGRRPRRLVPRLETALRAIRDRKSVTAEMVLAHLLEEARQIGATARANP